MKQIYFQFLVVLTLVGQSLISIAQTIVVTPADDLNQVIEDARGGNVVLIESGTYDLVRVEGRNFSENAPLIVRGKGEVVIDAKGGKALTVLSSSYIVFENIRFTNSEWEAVAVWDASHHVIFNNCRINKSERIGLKIAGSSHHIDWIGGKIWDTGNMDSQASFGEGIYLGHSSGDFARRASDHIWIEGVEIFDTGRGEAINVKPQATNVTIKDTYLHDIKTGAVNGITEGAISVEAFADTPAGGLQTWIENNEIENVEDPGGDRGVGIAFYNDPGVYIKNNILRNCDDAGIKAFLWQGHDMNLTNYQWNNTFENNGERIIIGDGANLSNANPGTNPNSKQTWYVQGPDNPDPTPSPDDLTGIYYFENRDSGKRMRSPNNLGGDMNLGGAAGTDNSYQFELIAVDGKQDTYFIESVLTGFRLSPDGGSNNAGTSVESFNGGGARVEWKIFPADNGYFYIESLLSSGTNLLKMRNDDCSDGDGTKVETHVGTGNCTKWKLIPVGSNASSRTASSVEPSLRDELGDIRLYPNPVKNELHIAGEGEYNVQLLDTHGRLIMSSSQHQGGSALDVSTVRPGVYLAKVDSAQGTKITRIVITE